MRDIQGAVRAYLVRRVAIEDVSVLADGDVDLKESGILDSFVMLDLVTFIETEFNVEVAQSDLDAGSLRTLLEIERLVLARIEEDE